MKRWIHAASENAAYDERKILEEEGLLAEMEAENDPERLADLFDIDWTDVEAVDLPSFFYNVADFPNLSYVKSVRYLDEAELDWASQADYDEGYVVQYRNGAVDYFVHYYGGENLIQLSPEEVDNLKEHLAQQ